MYSSNDEAMGVGLGGFLDVCAVRGMVGVGNGSESKLSEYGG